MKIYYILIALIFFLLLLLLVFKIPKENMINRDICICMSYTPNIKSYSEISEKINKIYANKNNYDFKVFNIELNDRSPQWSKIYVINKLLKENSYKYLFWIDSDAFFNDHNKKVEDIINNDSKDIIICNDDINSGNTDKNKITVNTGTIIIKCTNWTKDFFNLLWNYESKYKTQPFYEQNVFEEFIKLNKINCREHISIKDGKLFNSEINEQINKRTLFDNFVVHLAGLDEKTRIQYMNSWLYKHNLKDLKD